MAAQKDSDTSQELDSSVPGVVGNPEASDSSQDDTSSHETEAVAEETGDAETKVEADEDDTLLSEPLRCSSASKEAHTESEEILDESETPGAPPEQEDSPLLASDKPAELRPPLRPRLSTSLLSRARPRSSSTTPEHPLASESTTNSATASADLLPSTLAKDSSASKPPTLEQLRNKLAKKGSIDALRDKAEVMKLGGDHSEPVEREKSEKREQTSTQNIAEQPPTTTTPAPTVPRSLPPEYAPAYFPLPFEASSGGWDNAPSRPAATKTVSRYPLEHRWTFYQQTPHNSDANKKIGALSPNRPAYESSLTELGDATTVDSFARLFVPLKTPSTQDTGTSIYIFKDSIIPAWEHEANANGGKWSLLIKGDVSLLDRSWLWLVLALVGEQLVEENEVCGAVLSIRPRDNRIQLWCRDKSRISRLNALGRHLLNVLELSSLTKGLHFEFFPHNAGSSAPSSTCFSINNPGPGRPAKAAELRRGGSFDGSSSGLTALPEGFEGIHRIAKPSPLGMTMVGGSGWRKPATEAGESKEPAPSGGESDGWSAEGSTGRPAVSTSLLAWW